MYLKDFIKLFLVLFSVNLFATENLNINNNYLLNLKYGNTYFRYDEYDENGNILDSEKVKKNLNSISLKIKKRINSKYYFGIKFNYTYGKTKYVGQLQDGTPHEGNLKNTYIIEPSIFLNRKFKNNNNIKLMFGYRLWNRGYDKSDVADYNEKYYWYYIGIGYVHKIIINKNLSSNIEFQFKEALNPKLKIYLFNNPVLELGNTYGYLINIPLDYSFNKKFSIGLFYNFKFWKISKSKTKEVHDGNNIYFIYEPNSRTIMETIGFHINYKF